MAEIVLLFTMFLFVAFCAVILGVAIYEVYLRKGDEEGLIATSKQTNGAD